MELRDLRALVTVVRLGSFTKAAEQLGYTQSAISQQVAALESELGADLVQRRPVRPTAAGERLAEHGERIFLRLDVARSELANLGNEEQELAIAVTPLTAPHVLADALHQMRAGRPNLSVTIRAVDPREAIAEVALGTVQAALVDGIATPNEPLELADAGLLKSSRIAEAPLGVALPNDHPVLSMQSIDLEVLTDAPWVSAPRLLNDDGRLADLDVRRRPSRVVYEGLDVATLLSLVAANLGASLLPASTEVAPHGVTIRPLRTTNIVHRTELVTLRNASQLTGHLLEAFGTR